MSMVTAALLVTVCNIRIRMQLTTISRLAHWTETMIIMRKLVVDEKSALGFDDH